MGLSDKPSCRSPTLAIMSFRGCEESESLSEALPQCAALAQLNPAWFESMQHPKVARCHGHQTADACAGYTST
jgi:hypothetical protein